MLSALSSGVLYSFASFTDGDKLEFGTQTGRTSAVLAHNIKFYSKNLGRKFGRKKLHLFDSFVGLPDPFNNSVDSLNWFTIKGALRKNSLGGHLGTAATTLLIPHCDVDGMRYTVPRYIRPRAFF